MSQNPKDANGNELHEGDQVVIFLDKPMALGKIIKLHPGGLAIASLKGRTTPGIMVVASATTIQFEPGTQFPVIFKTIDPASEELVKKALAEQPKADA